MNNDKISDQAVAEFNWSHTKVMGRVDKFRNMSQEEKEEILEKQRKRLNDLHIKQKKTEQDIMEGKQRTLFDC